MSLFRTAARASVATRTVGRVHRRQQQRWAAEDAAAAQQPSAAQPPLTPHPGTATSTQTPTPATAAPSTDTTIAQLQQLASLRDAGVLNDAEFEQQKQRVLAGL